MVEEEGFFLDVVFGGEFYIVVVVGFLVECIYFYGNNKGREELWMVFEYCIGCIVVDNFYEILFLEDLCEEMGYFIDVFFWIMFGVEVYMYDYIIIG